MRQAVLFRGFWPNFTPQCAVAKFFLEIIKNIYQEDEITTASSFQEATILFESCFDGTALPWKRWHAGSDSRPKTFLFSGESYNLPNWRNYDIVFSGESAKEQNVVPLPLYKLYLLDIGEPPQPEHRLMPEKDVLVMISNPNGQVRSHFLQALETSDLKITYAGRYKNNIGGSFTHSFGTHEFNTFASQFKFIVTMENSQQENYITEKVLQGLFAENIPIYWGAPSIADYINPQRIVSLKEESSTEQESSIKETIERMRHLAANPDEWLETVRQPWRGPLADTLTPISLSQECVKKLSLKNRF
jgi:hypothetical protein